MQIHCAYKSLVKVADLKEHPKNRNSHPDGQIKRLAKILEYQGFRSPLKVSKRSGFITAGHGRLLAAKLLGLSEVPVDYQDYASEEQELADVHADNAIAAWSELDLDGIASDLSEFPGFDADLLGIKDFSLDPAVDDPTYTPKIAAPKYVPTGENPKASELYDETKANALREEIFNSELPRDIKDFLLTAAERHTVFDYAKIAEFYAHASAETQDFMERSALVIIDYDKAIENGFVTLSNEIAETYPDDEN